jgi:predicted polyphosphate/ATP-dependent NAD kinase
MIDTNDSRYKTGNPVCDAVRFLCDASFAILPRDAAQHLGEFEKNFWGSVRWFADKSVTRIDESLAAADRLREEWRRRCATPPTTTEGPEVI